MIEVLIFYFYLFLQWSLDIPFLIFCLSTQKLPCLLLSTWLVFREHLSCAFIVLTYSHSKNHTLFIVFTVTIIIILRSPSMFHICAWLGIPGSQQLQRCYLIRRWLSYPSFMESLMTYNICKFKVYIAMTWWKYIL